MSIRDDPIQEAVKSMWEKTELLKESTVGDYSYLLAVSMEYVNVE